MSWEISKNGECKYYYRNKWINGGTVRIYVGTGHVAEIAAAKDLAKRIQREAQSAKRLALFAVWKAADAPVAELDSWQKTGVRNEWHCRLAGMNLRRRATARAAPARAARRRSVGFQTG